MFKKITVLVILITLVASFIPTFEVLAKGQTAGQLEAQWKELSTSFETQSFAHQRIHKSVGSWLQTDKKAAVSDKAQVERQLAICNSAFAAARTLVAKHAGFDNKGKVTDVATARKTVKSLAFYLRQHAGSVKNLKEHMN